MSFVNNWKDKTSALQAFLLYFLERRKQLSAKISNINEPWFGNADLKTRKVYSQKYRYLPYSSNTMYSHKKTASKTEVRGRLTSDNISKFSSQQNTFTINEISEEDEKSIHFYRRESKCDLSMENTQKLDLINDNDEYLNDYTSQKSLSNLMFLNMICEIFIFHSLLILQKEDQKCEDLYRNEFFLLIK